MTMDRDGNLWTTHFDNRIYSSSSYDFDKIVYGISMFDGTSWNVQHFDRKYNFTGVTSCVTEDDQGRIWVGGEEKIMIYDGYTWQELTDPELQQERYFSVLYRDRRGSIWAGTGNGLYRYDGSGWSHFSTEDGLADNFIRTVFEDSRGNIWVGTSGGVSMAGDIGLPAGKIELTLNGAISCLPNPASDYMKVFFNDDHQLPVELILHDLEGKKIIEQHLSGTGSNESFLLDISGIPCGIYVLTMQTSMEVHSIKVVVRR
jgi:hypothetical protein